jgi:hypothetical protein
LAKLESILEQVDVDELQDAIKAYRVDGAGGGETKIVEVAEIPEEHQEEEEVEAAPVFGAPAEQEEMKGDDGDVRLSENNSQVTPRLSQKSRLGTESQAEPATSAHPSDFEDP